MEILDSCDLEPRDLIIDYDSPLVLTYRAYARLHCLYPVICERASAIDEPVMTFRLLEQGRKVNTLDARFALDPCMYHKHQHFPLLL